MCTKICI